MKYKTKLKQWEALANKLKDHGYTVTAVQCRNRYTTLERGYKRVKDHNNKTGRNRVKMSVSDEVKK